MALYFLSLSFLCLLAGSFSYELNVVELIGIALASYLFHEFILNRRRVFFWVGLSTLILTGIGIGVILYYDLSDLIIEPFMEFFADYYYSMVVEAYYIDELRQGVFLFLLGVIINKVMFLLYKNERTAFVNPLLILLFVVPAYLMESLGATFDKGAFVFFGFCALLYVFDLRFRRLKESGLQKKLAFFRVSVLIFLGVFLLAFSMQKSFPNPFMERITVGPAAVGSGGEYDPEVQEAREKLEKFITQKDEYEVSPNFSFDGIELFQVNAQKVKYYRTQTYNRLVEGKWTDTIETETDSVPDLAVLEEGELPVDYYQESIDITYKRIFTDLVIVPVAYTKIDAFLDPVEFTIGEDDTVASEDTLGEGTSYTVSAVLPKYGTKLFRERVDKAFASEINIEEFDMDKYLEVEDEYQDIVNLAVELTEEIEGKYEKALFLTEYLQKNYNYSIDPKYETQDYIREFLFDKKEGFCQQFASSLVIMLRGIGVPSRFAVGFVVNVEPDFEDGIPEELIYGNSPEAWNQNKSVFDSNAHAWVEIYVPNLGWIQLEPTPGQSIYQFSDPYEFIERSPNEQSTEFDAAKKNVKDQLLPWLYGGIIILVVAVLLRWILQRRKGRKDPARELFRYYRLILMYLKAYRLEKRPDETIREYALRIDGSYVKEAKEFSKYIEWFEGAFYHDRVISEHEIKELHHYKNQIRKNVRRAVSIFRYFQLLLFESVYRYR